MARCTQIVLTAALLCGTAALGRADESPLLGTWTHRADDHKVRLEIKADGLRCTITADDGCAVTVNADYVTSRDGVVLGIIRAKKAEKKGDEEDLNKRLFYFRVAVDEKTLVVSDLNYGGDAKDKTKELIEGKYRKVESKNATRAKCTAQQQTTGSVLFGVGVNSDAGLTGSVILNERNFDVSRPPAAIGDFFNGKASQGAGQELRVEPVPGTQLQRYTNTPQSKDRRMREPLNKSEDLRKTEQGWEGIWLPDQPLHLTPERVHGGIE
jgi:hypothetical protein